MRAAVCHGEPRCAAVSRRQPNRQPSPAAPPRCGESLSDSSRQRGESAEGGPLIFLIGLIGVRVGEDALKGIIEGMVHV